VLTRAAVHRIRLLLLLLLTPLLMPLLAAPPKRTSVPARSDAL